MIPLATLLARVSQATRPDRELSFAIDKALLAPNYNGTISDWYGVSWAHQHLTNSLDAALALAERVLRAPNAVHLHIDITAIHYPSGEKRSTATAMTAEKTAHSASAATPALALVAAVLTALIATRTDEETKP